MVKGQRKTRKSTRKQVKKEVLTIPQLRKAFQHMDKVVEDLRNKSKHSFSDAVLIYRKEWNKTFKRDISPADAASYLKFRYGLKSGKTRRSHMRGGALAGAPIAGAPLDYSLRAGVNGTYGQFPTYQQEGLDRYYGSALSADCGKPNGFPTDGSGATQKGGSLAGAFFRPLLSSSPPNIGYTTMMTDIKGTAPYPSSDPTGHPALRNPPTSYITNAPMASWNRSTTTDVYASTAR